MILSPEIEPIAGTLRRGSPDRFGYEWSIYKDVLPEHRVQLQRWLGEVTLESFRGKRVLDVGCGMGRNSYWMAMAGASSVLAVDVNEGSLRSARENLKPLLQVQVKEGSAYDLDAAEIGTFDRVVCIGVLHHLANPSAALAKMWSVVKPGGELILWCYGKEGNRTLLPLIQILRALGSRLPLPISHLMAKAVTALSWPLIRGLPWKTDYYRNLKSLSFRNVESIIFDQMIPHIAHYWTRDAMIALTQPLGGRVAVSLVQGNSWNVVVHKAL